MLNHGGNLQQARQLFPEVADSQWQDLSTGISPWSWPVPAIPSQVWQHLPQQTPAFKQAMVNYYGQDLLPTAGSQQAIQIVPSLLPASTVALPLWGYGEHEKAWRQAGHQVVYYHSYEALLALSHEVEHVVVINPNNPTGQCWSQQQLLTLQQKTTGYLLIDEAFIDALEQPSFLQALPLPRVIILRSLGKFFGLAGLRVGFVYLPDALQEAFKQRDLLWGVSGPALYITELALQDNSWQQQQKQRLAQARTKLLTLLSHSLPEAELNAGPIFVSAYLNQAKAKQVFEHCARHGVWLRIFKPKLLDPKTASQKTYLRFGLSQNIEPLQTLLSSLPCEA